MGFGKAFAIGLIIFMALTFVFALILGALDPAGIGGFFSTLVDPISNIFRALVGSVSVTPTIIFMALQIDIMLGTMSLVGMLGYLSPLIIMLIAAIITGRLAEGKGAAFGAWLLICIIASVLLMVAGIIAGIPISPVIILGYFLPAIINGIFYGAFALLACGSEYY